MVGIFTLIAGYVLLDGENMDGTHEKEIVVPADLRNFTEEELLEIEDRALHKSRSVVSLMWKRAYMDLSAAAHHLRMFINHSTIEVNE